MCIRTIINRLYCAIHLEYTRSIAIMNITSMILGPLCSKIVTVQCNWSFLGTNKKNCVTYSHNSEYFIKIYKCTFVISSSVCNEKG